MSFKSKKIDVCIPTWNSGRTLSHCLRSIVKEIPVNRILIADNFSTDETLHVAREFQAVIIQQKCGIGKARQMLIDEVSTDFFAFIDSDVVLREGWFKAIMKVMESDARIGAVCGLWFSDNPQDRHYWEIWWRRVRLDDPIWKRGYLIDTMIRTQAVKGISIPDKLNNYEDKFIREFITSRGYKWIPAKNATSDHLVGEAEFWKTILGRRIYGAGLRRWKDVDPNATIRKLLSDGLREPVLSTYTALKSKDPIIFPYRFLNFLFILIGYLSSGEKMTFEMEKDKIYKKQFSKYLRE